MIGTTVSHFRLTAKLGQGGMGEVYRAEGRNLGRAVAIKVLPEEVATDPERLARCEREARVPASLNHPNIAAIHSLESSVVSRPSPAGTDVGLSLAGAREVHFLVMELVEGRTPGEVCGFDIPGIHVDDPVWSSDGTRVVFDRAEPQGSDIWLLEGL